MSEGVGHGVVFLDALLLLFCEEVAVESVRSKPLIEVALPDGLFDVFFGEDGVSFGYCEVLNHLLQ